MHGRNLVQYLDRLGTQAICRMMRVPVPVDVEVAPAVFEERMEANVEIPGGARPFGGIEVVLPHKLEPFVTDGLPVLTQQIELRKLRRVENGLSSPVQRGHVEHAIELREDGPALAEVLTQALVTGFPPKSVDIHHTRGNERDDNDKKWHEVSPLGSTLLLTQCECPVANVESCPPDRQMLCAAKGEPADFHLRPAHKKR